jgi:asparagine synthase (glutamine-hydrolysing)
MCGIFFYLGKQYTLQQLMPHFMASSHRGPDSSFLRSIGNNMYMGFHRLAIVDMSREGDQPFENVETGNFAMCNGEIYNHTIIRKKLNTHINTKSDCGVILPLYEKVGIREMMNRLDGDFGFLVVDVKTNQIHLGRDPVGVKPLFYTITPLGEFIVASEMKSIKGLVKTDVCVKMLPSGTSLTYDVSKGEIEINRYWNPTFPLSDYTESKVPYSAKVSEANFRTLLEPALDAKSKAPQRGAYIWHSTVYNEEYLKRTISDKLTLAVKKRLMADRPIGLLISGGLDSSLIAGITAKLLGPEKIHNIHSFSIGMPGSPDTVNAQIVADYLGTNHHTVDFSAQAGIAVIRDVIKQLETYDITTIRASTPQYLLSKYISENTDVKVILSGEGSDELFGGYLYSHLAPSNDDLQLDSERLMKELEVYDVLRTDRTTAGNGLEVRVPFLDRGFVKFVANIPGKYKNPNESSGFGKRIEKDILRNSFSSIGLIPDEILYRTKNAFSDACGYDWIPSLQKHFDILISDEEFSTREVQYPHLTPKTKEAFYYRKTFEEFYPFQEKMLEHYWLPNWVDNNGEPSAKILNLV